MAASVAQSTVGRNNTGTTLTVTLPGATTTGNTLVALGNTWQTTYPTYSDNGSHTWNTRQSAASTQFTESKVRGSDALNITGRATHTVTMTIASADSKILIPVELAGVTTSPYDTGTTASAASNQAPAVTCPVRSAADAIILAAAAYLLQSGADTTITEPSSPWVFIAEEEDSANYGNFNAVYQIVSDTATKTATWTVGSTAGRGPVMTMAYLASGGAATTAPPPRRQPWRVWRS